MLDIQIYICYNRQQVYSCVLDKQKAAHMMRQMEKGRRVMKVLLLGMWSDVGNGFRWVVEVLDPPRSRKEWLGVAGVVLALCCVIAAMRMAT